MCDAYFKFKSVEIDSSTTYSAQSAYLLEIYVFQRFSGIYFVNGAEGSFHNTARSAEDNAGTSGFSHGVVERAIQHQRKTYISPFDKSGELAGGDRVVYIGDSIYLKLVAGTFIFLCQAGHDRNHYQLFFGDSHFLCPV